MIGRPDPDPRDAAVERAAAAIVCGRPLADDEAAAEVRAAWDGIEALRDDPRIFAWRREALWAGGWSRRPAGRIVAGIAAALLACVAVGHKMGIDPRTIMDRPSAAIEQQVYRTGAGQRAEVTLQDGSIVTLDTDSEVVISFPGHRRLVNLRRGHAYFGVAHDKTRPFIVTAMGKTVTALGTAFGVTVDHHSVAVVLVEGAVKVAEEKPSTAPPSASRAGVVLKPGMKLVATKDGWTVATADVNKEIGWTRGKLVFDDQSIELAVAEMNRYSARKIRLDNPALRARRISGVFPMGEPRVLARSLASYGLAQIEADDDMGITLR